MAPEAIALSAELQALLAPRRRRGGHDRTSPARWRRRRPAPFHGHNTGRKSGCILQSRGGFVKTPKHIPKNTAPATRSPAVALQSGVGACSGMVRCKAERGLPPERTGRLLAVRSIPGGLRSYEIGRASCRERGEISVV